MIARDGTFHDVLWPPAEVLTEAFRRTLLPALVKAARLAEETRDAFLSRAHSGFSVQAEQRVEPEERDSLARLLRYATRPALAAGAVTWREDGRVDVETPKDPRTGAESVVLSSIEFVHAVTNQIPDASSHLVRCDGAHSHRARAGLRAAREAAAETSETGAGLGAVPVARST